MGIGPRNCDNKENELEEVDDGMMFSVCDTMCFEARLTISNSLLVSGSVDDMRGK